MVYSFCRWKVGRRWRIVTWWLLQPMLTGNTRLLICSAGALFINTARVTWLWWRIIYVKVWIVYFVRFVQQQWYVSRVSICSTEVVTWVIVDFVDLWHNVLMNHTLAAVKPFDIQYSFKQYRGLLDALVIVISKCTVALEWYCSCYDSSRMFRIT